MYIYNIKKKNVCMCNVYNMTNVVIVFMYTFIKL